MDLITRWEWRHKIVKNIVGTDTIYGMHFQEFCNEDD